MEKTDSVLDTTETLKFKILVLKVLIHCEGCRKKVKKVVQSIEGVYKTEVDPLQHKVVVTGSVDANILIKKLLKNGKQAEIWPESTTTINKFDDKNNDANQEKRKLASSGKSKKSNENKHENSLVDEAHKMIPAKTVDENYNIVAKHSKNKFPAEKMPSGNHFPANNLHLIEHAEKIGEKVTALDGCGGCGNSRSEAKRNLDKKVENGEGQLGHINNNATPPPLMMAEYFPPPCSNVVAPPNDVTQPMIPAAEYREVMSYNNSSYSSSNGDSAFYAPPAPQPSYAYSGPHTNGYYCPPPPPDPIRPPFTNHNNDYYYDDDDEVGCSIM